MVEYICSMDLRITKTRKAIYEAFMELGKMKPLGKISVKELCSEAMINKTTFYLHYENMEDLISSLQDELIESCLSFVDESRLEQPSSIVMEFYRSFSTKSEAFRILFAGSHIEKAARKGHEFVRKKILERFPGLKNDMEFQVRLTMAMYGCFYAYLENRDRNLDAIMPLLAEAASDCLPLSDLSKSSRSSGV